MPDFVAAQRDAPTIQSGLRDPNSTQSARIKIDMADEIFLYMPSAAPLTALTSKFRKKRKVENYRFDILEKDEFPRSLVVSGAQTAGDTALEVATGHGDRAAAGYILLNTRTREQVRVSSVSTDTLTVVRAIGTGNSAMLDGDTLVFLRSVSEDGSDIGTLKSVKETNIYNYTEIMRRPFGWTRRQAGMGMYGGRDPQTERKWQGIEHEKDKENMFYFGRRYSRTGSGGKLETYSGGLEHFITSNIWDLNGIKPTERAWIEFMEEAMRWGMGGNQSGSGTKYLFASSRWCSEMNSWALDKLEYRPMDTVLGIKAMEYQSPHGKIMVIKSPILDYAHQDYAFLVDLNHVRYTYFDDTSLLKDREANGIDGVEEEFLSDIGLEVTIESSHALLKGLPV